MRTAIVSEGALADGLDRLVVSEAHGTVRLEPVRSYVAEGEYVLRGDVVAHVVDGSSSMAVKAKDDGWVVACLVSDGDRVEPGTPMMHVRLV